MLQRKLALMVDVSDALLLELAGIAASLLGFFVVGVFFYVQRGMFPQAPEAAHAYLRAATGTVILLYGMTLFVALSLVALPVQWSAVVHAVSSAALLWSVVQTAAAGRRLHGLLGVRVISQAGMWSGTAAVVGLPWLLGGWRPTLEHLTSTCLVAGALAFASSASLVLSTFDIAGLEAGLAGEHPLGAVPETSPDGGGENTRHLPPHDRAGEDHLVGPRSESPT